MSKTGSGIKNFQFSDRSRVQSAISYDILEFEKFLRIFWFDLKFLTPQEIITPIRNKMKHCYELYKRLTATIATVHWYRDC